MNNRTNGQSQLIGKAKVNTSYRSLETPELDQPCLTPNTTKEDVTQIESQFRMLEKAIAYTREVLSSVEVRLQPIRRPQIEEECKAPAANYTTVPLAQRLEACCSSVESIRVRLDVLLNEIEL